MLVDFVVPFHSPKYSIIIGMSFYALKENCCVYVICIYKLSHFLVFAGSHNLKFQLKN